MTYSEWAFISARISVKNDKFDSNTRISLPDLAAIPQSEVQGQIYPFAAWIVKTTGCRVLLQPAPPNPPAKPVF